MKKRREIVVDNFAGGGGASTGIEMAIGRSVDIAINHDPDAIAMHTANHPNTKHYCENVFDVDPVKAAAGRPVALAWFSPDCKHFSKAKGGTPVNKEIRGLAWVALRWASKVRPRVIMLENVEEFQTWGPLEAVRDDKTGRIVTTDLVRFYNKKTGKWTTKNRIAEPGEVTPNEKQLFAPIKEKKGQIFKKFIKHLEALGYTVEYDILKACDFGAPTTRKRLFLIARCDKRPIVWPQPTHGHKDSEEVEKGYLKPYRAASEIIDFSKKGKSIFNRKKPLSPATMKRIARGLFKFVLNEPDPFIVRIGQTGFGKDGLQYPIDEPLTTITTKAEHCLVTPTVLVNTTGHKGSKVDEPLKTVTTGGHHALISPTLIQMGYGDPEGKRVLNMDQPIGTVTSGGNKFAFASAWIKEDYGNSTGTTVNNPLGTITSQSNHHSLMTAFLSKHYGGNYKGAGIDPRNPTDTITQVDHHSLVTAFISKSYGGQTRSVASDIKDPMHTITARNVHSLCEIELNGNIDNSLQVKKFLSEYSDDVSFGYSQSAFLTKYYGNDVGQSLDEPIHTIPTKDRFGLVTIKGVDYQITDITLRMLDPRELFNAMGFPENYVIDRDHENKVVPKSVQVGRCGNAVSPNIPVHLVRSNLPELCSMAPFEEQVELLNADFGF
ncbi:MULTISPECIES: DNA cytosine methyltransferase [unclassified Enterococcus]|uniref:DNA cytosine methyltransferase n=1 Tax=unclassified Enterococcus TaxID=2608891 RepID=UPI001CE095F2|nr:MULTISPECIES: DNA cytosine methyltransferase [unclassified Enterococcus]MCA5014575.1 DNA cytosine methyltransferase [Enterococcus sp. S23]MCA5017828.1 DNA cytosine methyltransferase [Enterococcus sp. S22(2020)]